MYTERGKVFPSASALPDEFRWPGRTDGSAEWNVYWDPLSAKKVIDAGKSRRTGSFLMILLGPKLRICPLDVCNQAPITTKFLADLYGVAVQSSGALKVVQVYADQALHP